MRFWDLIERKLEKRFPTDPKDKFRIQRELHICTICLAGVDMKRQEDHYSWHRRNDQ